jgi:hypothetical protein
MLKSLFPIGNHSEIPTAVPVINCTPENTLAFDLSNILTPLPTELASPNAFSCFDITLGDEGQFLNKMWTLNRSISNPFQIRRIKLKAKK